jgi:uncharacterized protein YybS (DUF2232 family)
MAHTVPRPLLLIGMGALSSLLFLSLLSGMPAAIILSFFCQAPLFYVALTQGARDAIASVLSACLCAALLLDVGVGFVFFFLFGAPCLLLSHVLLSRAPGRKKESKAASLVLIQQLYSLLLMTFLFGMVEISLRNGIVDQLMPLLSKAPFKNVIPHLSADVVAQGLRIMPGFALLWTMMATFVSGALVHTLLTKWRLSLVKKSFRLEKLNLPLWPWILLVVSGLATIFFRKIFLGPFCANVLLVLMMVFLVQGVSIMHAFCLGRPHGAGLLWIFYAFVVFFQELALVVVVMGILEPWLQMRRRIEIKMRRKK